MKGDKDKEVDESQAWYLAEGARGQQMLDHGQAAEATTVFAAMLARIGDGPSFARSVILGRLGRCCQVTGRLEFALQHAREALRVIGSLPPSDGVKGLRGTLRSDIGDALRAAGHYSDARKAYEAALKIAEELNDTRAQGVELGHLGALALTEGRLEDALTCQQAALGLFRRIDEPDMEAAAWHQLGRVFHKQGQWEEAERHYQEAGRISEERGRLASAARTFSQLAALAAEAGRSGGAETWYSKAIDVARRAGHPRQLEHCLHDFAGHLLKQPDRLADARQLAAEALAIAQDLAPAAAETWQRYGLLADIIDRDALTVADREQRTALETQARDYRELQRRAPVIADALTRIGPLPGDGRAVLLQQLGRSFHIGSRPDLAVACAREAINITTALAPGNGRDALQVGLHSDLGDMLRARA